MSKDTETTADMRNQHGAISWGELMTTDTAAAAEFYGKVLGWTSETADIGHGEYTCFTNREGKAVAGALLPPPGVPEGTPPHWGMYVTVNDVDAACQIVTENGGTVHCPPTDLAGVGRIAHFADPQGAMMAVICYEQPIE
ncbi:MAG: VOC family protein [Akkermansiaceae bacterium]